MAYNIGDRVLVGKSGEAIITDRMYSEKSDKYLYCIRYKGRQEEQDDLYGEDDIQPYVEEKVEYELKTEISDGVVIFSCIEIRGDKRTLVARGHGHMLKSGTIGVLQAASWAARKAFTEVNGGEIHIVKEN